ncbi:MAG: copper chaperone PCu(A)C [Moraxellaceae bacterium]|nr:MAG: copper chaperone PCu(A)C [Moraxellaceae bacterium]
MKRLAVNYLLKCIALVTIFSSVTFSSKSPAADARTSDINVTNAFFYVPLGASKTTTAFFTITNNSNKDISVVAISSSAANQIRLMPENSLLIPAHQSVALKSSGRYVQINDLKIRLTTGDELHLVVSLSNGQKLELIALAKSAYDQIHSH